MRGGVAGQAGRAAASVAARLKQRLSFKGGAARTSVREVLAGAFCAVGDDQRLVSRVVALAGPELVLRIEQRKERIARAVAARADRERQLLIDAIGANDVAFVLR